MASAGVFRSLVEVELFQMAYFGSLSYSFLRAF